MSVETLVVKLSQFHILLEYSIFTIVLYYLPPLLPQQLVQSIQLGMEQVARLIHIFSLSLKPELAQGQSLQVLLEYLVEQLVQLHTITIHQLL